MTRINDNGVDRDMTSQELADYAAFQNTTEKQLAEIVATIEARAAALASAQKKLAALGLTEEEVGALLGR